MSRSLLLLRRHIRLLAAMAVLGSSASLGLAAVPAAASPSPTGTNEGRSASVSTPGACSSGRGVTVVIDFQELGGGSYVRCAPDAPGSGFKALAQAGISYDTTARSPGFLCRIAGKPADDACQVPSPTTAYWSYWVAPRGGNWCYANLGAGNRTPPPGTVEGWSFSLNKTGAATPPPSIAPPSPIPGSPAPQLPGKDCTVPTTEVTTTTTAPSTTRPAPGSDSTEPSNPATPPKPTRPSSTGSTGAAGGPGSGNGSGDAQDGSSSSPKTEGDDSTTSAPSSDGSPATTLGNATDPDGEVDRSGADTEGANPNERTDDASDRGKTDPAEIAALEGDVDLGDDGRSNGSPVPLVAAGVVATGLVAGGIRQRRRHQAASDPT